jgi:tetratricopeptide (TPR) repeat protein
MQTVDPLHSSYAASLSSGQLSKLDPQLFKEPIGQLCENIASRFRTLLKRHLFFHVTYCALFACELLLALLLFPFFVQTSILAISLAILFLSGFSYFVLRLYLQTKKVEQLLSLRDLYIHSCQKLVGYQEGIAEHHRVLANALCRLSTTLEDFEHAIHKTPSWLDSLAPAFDKLSFWLYWRVVLTMREALLFYAIEEYIKLVKCEPTNLEIHSALANAYVMLSQLYIDPRSLGKDAEEWAFSSRYAPQMQMRFKSAAQRAIEEFHILSAYAPDDPWVHAQLAYSFHELQMPQAEIEQYETIMKLCPNDLDTLFRLGIRYFQQGMSAKGLQVYEELKMVHYPKVDELIQFYGASLPPPLDG